MPEAFFVATNIKIDCSVSVRQMGKNIYASVKSYSQRGKLLSREDLQTLAESRDLEELVTRIKNTAYVDSVTGLSKPYSSQRIEMALRGHLADIQYTMSRTAADESAVLDAYYIRHMISNLKLILKGKALGKSQEEIEPHLNLHAEELVKQRDTVIKALVSKDVEEAVASLKQVQMGEEAAKAAALYAEKGNLQIFDVYFDKIMYGRLGAAIRGSRDRDVVGLVGMDIDFYNIQSAVRGKFWGLSEQQVHDLMVQATPSVPKDLLSRMTVAASIREAFAELGNTRYRDVIPRSEDDLDALAEFERSFENKMYAASNRSFSRMFSPATVVGIIKLSTYETRNMAAIAFAVEQGIPTETVMPKLIIR